ncbi:hypothetical protein [Vibrio sp. 624788]|uniref:hypothetical protein n=1 Tax=Vibrio sp. 624788 TaxID=1234362 RepID=UPI0002F0128B|nr:hypothetical protein [Vibrio sp. 624788]
MDQTDDENVWSNIMPVGLKFPDNTTAYKLSVEDINDNIYTFYKGDWCAEHAMKRSITCVTVLAPLRMAAIHGLPL